MRCKIKTFAQPLPHPTFRPRPRPPSCFVIPIFVFIAITRVISDPCPHPLSMISLAFLFLVFGFLVLIRWSYHKNCPVYIRSTLWYRLLYSLIVTYIFTSVYSTYSSHIIQFCLSSHSASFRKLSTPKFIG